MAQNFFTREMYKKLKKMDRQQAESFIYNIYQTAYTDGGKAAQSLSLDLELLHQKLLEIKGIGKSRADSIIALINELAKEK